jgi:dynein heavy chain
MDKCFEGIAELVFTKNFEVEGMKSAESEVIHYLDKIDVNEGDKKGNVENWLLEVES